MKRIFITGLILSIITAFRHGLAEGAILLGITIAITAITWILCICAAAAHAVAEEERLKEVQQVFREKKQRTYTELDLNYN